MADGNAAIWGAVRRRRRSAGPPRVGAGRLASKEVAGGVLTRGDDRRLAEFTATHGEPFHRVESVARMQDGTLCVLDLTDPDIRETIQEAEDTQALYLGVGADDY